MEIRMNKRSTNHITVALFLLGTMVLGFNGLWTPPTYGHGGKTHGGQSFTALQALQKATGLYDKLIISGKLPENWETGLVTVVIDIRQSKGQREYVVEFKRAEGDQRSVYFFFDQEGQYSGSNFTGK
jgi:hypothetical protein